METTIIQTCPDFFFFFKVVLREASILQWFFPQLFLSLILKNKRALNILVLFKPVTMVRIGGKSDEAFPSLFQ